MELHIAMGFGTEEDIQRLIDEGCDVNVPDARGWYPLHRAVDKNNYKRAKLFLTSGGKPECKLAHNHCMGYNSECSALFIAVQNSNVELVRLLVESGADVNSTDSNGWTPLHTLLVPSTFYQTFGLNVPNVKQDFSSNDIEIFNILLQQGADVNAITTGSFRGFCAGTSTVHMAARCGNISALQLLMLNDAVTDKIDGEGKSASNYAEEIANQTCINMLHGINSNVQVKSKETDFNQTIS